MNVVFDTNVYVAEALLGGAAEALIRSTERASWRIYACEYLLDELERVLVDHLGFSRRLARLARGRVIRRSCMVEPGTSRHAVDGDPADTPILLAALTAGANYLVTNDRHLLDLDPYEGLRIVSMAEYLDRLRLEGLLV